MAIEVTEVKGAPKFPRAYRARQRRHVVLFFSEFDGVVIEQGESTYSAGFRDTWGACTSDGWEPVNLSITHD